MEKGQHIFTVIIGDLVRSSTHADRRRLAHVIPSSLGQITKTYKEEFYAPIVQTQGIDELSGVLKRPYMSYQICRFLNERVYPDVFRFALVQDSLDIGIRSKDARKMDGHAFHRAAYLIKQAKKENSYYSFELKTQPISFNSLLSQLANILHIIRSNWTDHQRNVTKLYEELGKQKATAENLGITQQGVSDAMRQAHYWELRRAEDLIKQLLGEIT